MRKSEADLEGRRDQPFTLLVVSPATIGRWLTTCSRAVVSPNTTLSATDAPVNVSVTWTDRPGSTEVEPARIVTPVPARPAWRLR